jgi:SAM-dependent methyltransferase
MDRPTILAYDAGAAAFARDWHDQPPPEDMYRLLRRFFVPGRVADVGCGAGREVGWLAANGYEAIGYDASEGLLAQAREHHPGLAFERAALPALAGVADASFDNVLCETVIMHLPVEDVAPSVRRLMQILKAGGVLYLSWRVEKADARDAGGRLYAAVDAALVRRNLGDVTVLLDEEAMSESSSRRIHRLVARKNARAAAP